MKLGDEDATFCSFPANFQTPENRAFGYAVDRQMKRLMELSEKLLVWPCLENVDARYYDMLAACIGAPYYSSEYDDVTKLRILKNALATYQYAGTVRAVEQLIGGLFGDAEFVPWYRYGGEEYHFKIATSIVPSEDSIQRFADILQRVKAARSVIDGIETSEQMIDVRAFLSGFAEYCEEISEI